MTPPILHATPRWRAVLLAQIRAVGFILRRPAIAGAALAGLATILITIDLVREGGPIDFAPELSMLPGMAGLLLPIGVWFGEERFGAGFLWTLPVDRRRHALARVVAGWVWLMAAVALFVLWLFALSVFSGGSILSDETLRLLPSFTMPAAGMLDQAALQTVRWTPVPLYWLVPFTAATATYLLASAFGLGTRRPLWWLVGIGLGLFLVSAAGATARVEWLNQAPDRVMGPLFYGRYGFDALLTARTESLHTEVRLSTGETLGVWRALPSLGDWITATLLWTGTAVAALWAALWRHRERRRA